MAKKKPQDSSRTPLRRVLDYLDWVEARVMSEYEARGEYSGFAIEAFSDLRRDLVSDADIYEIVMGAVKIGAVQHAASRIDQHHAYWNLKGRQRRGGEATKLIPEDHRRKIESKATTLRSTDPKAGKSITSLCKALAVWLSNPDTKLTNGKAVSWGCVRDYLERSGYLNTHFKRRQSSSL